MNNLIIGIAGGSGSGKTTLALHSKCTVRTLGSNVTIQMVGSVFVLYCEIPTRQ